MLQDYSAAASRIQQILKDYVQSSGLRSLVVGVSGGIDSALTCALAKPVCDELGIPLIGRSLSIVSNKADEQNRAIEMGKHFCHDFQAIDLSEAYHALAPQVAEDHGDADHEHFGFKVRMGNVKARLRMIYLYDLAQRNSGMVLSTDNYTELLLGFWTLHGDVGDYGMIQNLWKTEVYEMSRHLAHELADPAAAKALLDCANAVPTDGLGITNSDLDQIKASSYAEVDERLDEMERLGDSLPAEKAQHPVIQRHRSSAFKRENPYNIPRALIVG